MQPLIVNAVEASSEPSRRNCVLFLPPTFRADGCRLCRGRGADKVIDRLADEFREHGYRRCLRRRVRVMGQRPAGVRHAPGERCQPLGIGPAQHRLPAGTIDPVGLGHSRKILLPRHERPGNAHSRRPEHHIHSGDQAGRQRVFAHAGTEDLDRLCGG